MIAEAVPRDVEQTLISATRPARFSLARKSIRIERGWVLREIRALSSRECSEIMFRHADRYRDRFFYGGRFLRRGLTVRGIRREQRGEMLPPSIDGDRVVLRYLGLDKVERSQRLQFSSTPRLSAKTRNVQKSI